MAWVLLSRVWRGWRSTFQLVSPDTVVAWHRRGFGLYWRWRSRPRGRGRPAIRADLRDLIQEMQRANPLWGAPRIDAELLKLGLELSQATVAKYMRRWAKPPSQHWRTFLANHASQVILSHDRRRVIHFNVTAHPTAEWTAQQLREAWPDDTAPAFLVRDRDTIFGGAVQRTLQGMGI